MKRTPGLIALALALAAALAACGGGSSSAGSASTGSASTGSASTGSAATGSAATGSAATGVNAWQSGPGGKDVAKIAEYLAAANQAVLSGKTTDARGGGALLLGLTQQAAGDPPPADSAAYKQEMADLEAYAKALIKLEKAGNIALLTVPLDQAQAVLNQHKADWWAQKLNDAMKVQSQ